MRAENLHLSNPAVAERHLLLGTLVQYPEGGIAALDAHAQMEPLRIGNRIGGIEGKGLKTVSLPTVSGSATTLVGIIGTDRSGRPVGDRIPAHAPVLWVRTHKGGISGHTELVRTFRGHQQFFADSRLRRIVQKY